MTAAIFLFVFMGYVRISLQYIVNKLVLTLYNNYNNYITIMSLLY